jgi:SAM-dependent methyltransferase
MMNITETVGQNYYTNDFYDFLQIYSRQSAEEIVPLILAMLPCQRVIDVGCGDGTWLKTFQEYGVQEILGVDGSYVDESILVISKENFLPYDLTKPLKLDKQFDLVMSLEVAEHLPAESAESFIDSLTSLGAVILFSAAIPEQGGDNHINEQWQEYWAEKFQQRGYVVFDYIRKKIWRNSKVAVWYSQNILLFIDQNYLKNHEELYEKLKYYEVNDISSLSIIHPQIYLERVDYLKKAENKNPAEISLRYTMGIFPTIIIHAIKRQVNLLLSRFFQKLNSL